MGTTQGFAAVDVRGIEQELNDLLLNGRGNTLPHVLNGRSAAPSDDKAARYRKDIVQQIKHPFAQLYVISACDLADGVPFSEAVAPYRRLIALLEVVAVAGALKKPDRPTPTLMRKATKEFSEFAVAGLTVVERPDSADALETLRREAQDCEEVLSGIVSHCERAQAHLTVSRGEPGPQYGARMEIGR